MGVTIMKKKFVLGILILFICLMFAHSQSDSLIGTRWIHTAGDRQWVISFHFVSGNNILGLELLRDGRAFDAVGGNYTVDAGVVVFPGNLVNFFGENARGHISGNELTIIRDNLEPWLFTRIN